MSRFEVQIPLNTNEDRFASCPYCGPKSELTLEVAQQTLRFNREAGEPVSQEVTVQIATCQTCEESNLTWHGLKAIYDKRCTLLSRVTLDEIEKLRELVKSCENTKQYSTWKKFATVILACDENTLHRWQRFDGIPSLQTSNAIRDMIKHPELIGLHIQRYEDPLSV